MNLENPRNLLGIRTYHVPLCHRSDMENLTDLLSRAPNLHYIQVV